MVYFNQNNHFSKYQLKRWAFFAVLLILGTTEFVFGESGVIIIATVVGTLGDGPSVPFHIHSDLSNLNWAQFV